MPNYNETATDTGVAQSETVARSIARTIADTLSFSDYIGAFVRRSLADTGVTQTDTPVRFKSAVRPITQTGVTQTDQFVVKSFRLISDTAVTNTDSIGALVIPAPDSPFDFLCSRNWICSDDARKWTANAYARFTYTTIAD